MATATIRDIPAAAWEQFQAAAKAEGVSAEAKVRQCILREAQRWEATMEEDKVLAKARWLRRYDGQLLHGSLTFRMSVVDRDWEGVAYLADIQENSHGVNPLDDQDWEYIKTEAAKDGYSL